MSPSKGTNGLADIPAVTTPVSFGPQIRSFDERVVMPKAAIFARGKGKALRFDPSRNPRGGWYG